MKAALLVSPRTIDYTDVPDPNCPADGIILRVDACGICGSDLRTYEGGSSYAVYPAILGHEITGEIVESNNEDFLVGKKLSVAPVIPCGHCYYCQRGNQNLCDNLKMIGIGTGIPGGFAEFLALTGEILEKGCVSKIPDGVDNLPTVLAEPASSCICCQENAGVTIGDTVLVIGSGTMGCLNAVIAKIRGAKEVVMVEGNHQKAELARSVGMDTVFEMMSNNPDLPGIIKDLTKGRGVDVALTACPSNQAQIDAMNLVRKGGKLIFFGGLPKGVTTAIDGNIVHYREVNILGANAYSPRHFRTAIELILSGKINANDFITNQYALKDLDQGFSDIKNGKSVKGIINNQIMET